MPFKDNFLALISEFAKTLEKVYLHLNYFDVISVFFDSNYAHRFTKMMKHLIVNQFIGHPVLARR